MGLPAVPTSWEPMAAVPELDLEVINLPDELIFAARRAGEPIGGVNADVESDDLPDQNEDSERSAYCTLADQIGMASGGCRSGWDLPIRVFLLFFSISIFEKLAINTNLYAASQNAGGYHQSGRYAGKRSRAWKETSAGELMIWGLLFIWSSSKALRCEIFGP